MGIRGDASALRNKKNAEKPTLKEIYRRFTALRQLE
jgi:hypothetical protein